MPGLVRRLVIFATVDGLLLQAHGQAETHRSLLIDYKSQQISERARGTSHQNHDTPRLEAYGLIGFLNVASQHYLIAITKREEVARVLDKPIYLVTNIALLPISSQQAASDAIGNALGSPESVSDDSDTSLSDSEDAQSVPSSSNGLATTPNDDISSHRGKNSESTSIAENVAMRNVSFGSFASQWFSREKWSESKNPTEPTTNELSEPKPASKDDMLVDDVEKAMGSKRSMESRESTGNAQSPQTRATVTVNLLPRILRTTKMILTSGSYFFSYDFDLTRRIDQDGLRTGTFNIDKLDTKYFWNRQLGSKLLENDYSTFLTPLLQGFVGQRAFRLLKASPNGTAEVKEVTDNIGELKQPSGTDENEQAFLLTLFSRRSTKRSGLRYLRRGIDDNGNVANFVETEQIISAADWSPSVATRAFVQVRGSIPLYFSQSPYSFKPVPVFHNSSQANGKAYDKHFRALKHDYGAIQIALLVNRHATEKPIGEAYEKLYNQSRDNQMAEDVSFEWFDFHSECRGMKFENVSRLVDKLNPFLLSSGETVFQNGQMLSRQKGVIRTNCMDCLDRTNVAQSAFAQHQLQASLQNEGYSIDFVTDTSTNWFNTLWADNGDAISRQYASTAALKGDFTRTRKRNWRGAMNDFGLTISRYYSNMVNDYFSQTILDMLLGNVTWKVFEDFESTMMSADPGISVQSGREAAIDTCSKIVIQEPEKEDLIHAWTMLVPNQENTLRTLPFEEAVVLLTDAALYCCRMDRSTEKLARYERVDLRSVKSIRWGVYVTSTFTERQTAEETNQGLVIYYTPGKEDVVRVNTRSLSNYHVPDQAEGERVDGGTGILSWAASSITRYASHDSMMALKVLPPNDDDDLVKGSKAGSPKQIAEGIADEIRRALVGSTQFGEQRGKEMIIHSEIISAGEARKRTGYLEQASHSLKKFVWV